MKTSSSIGLAISSVVTAILIPFSAICFAGVADVRSDFEYTCRIWIDGKSTGRSSAVSIQSHAKQLSAKMNGIEAKRSEHPDSEKARWGFYYFDNLEDRHAASAVGFEVQPDLMAGFDTGWIYLQFRRRFEHRSGLLYSELATEKMALLCFRK